MVSDSLDRRRLAQRIAAARGGCRVAWTELICLIAPPIRLWLTRSGLQAADVEDLTQDVLLAVYRSLHKFDPRQPAANFHGWLKTITLNRLQDWRRRRALRREVGLSQSLPGREQAVHDGAGSDALPTQRNNSDARQLDVLLSLRREFQSASWHAFWRMVVHGDSAADIAEQTNVSAASVRQAKYRVLHRLRQRMTA